LKLKRTLEFRVFFVLQLLIALLNGIEHSDKQWKHLFALPVPRAAVYLQS
jgi:hypothetical protein